MPILLPSPRSHRAALRPRVHTLPALGLCFCLGLCRMVAAENAQAKDPRGGSATVEYVAPELFSDIELPDSTTEESIRRLLPELTETIQESAARRLPPGHVVHLRVRDLDLAGKIARAAIGNPRVVGRNLPAIIEFDYTYTRNNGQPPSTGSKRLSRLPNETDSFIAASGDLYLLRSMLDGWLQRLAKGKP